MMIIYMIDNYKRNNHQTQQKFDERRPRLRQHIYWIEAINTFFYIKNILIHLFMEFVNA